MQESNVEVFKKNLGKSETKKIVHTKVYYFYSEENNGGGQASYNIPQEFINILMRENVLIDTHEVVKARNGDENKIYMIDLKYKIILDSTLKKYLKEDIQKKIQLFITMGNGNKPQIRPSSYKELENKEKFKDFDLKWFKELYDNNYETNTIIYELNVDLKTIKIGIEEKIIENEENIVRYNEELKPKPKTPKNEIQTIYYGAPGTGKSFKLNEEAKVFNENYKRITFHPNYMYGNFIGTYKPYTDSDDKIKYGYHPGPMLELLLEALKNPNENYLLIIEEINRANVAAVFGDFFQLLDRDKNGNSEYPITTSKDLRDYLEKYSFENGDELKNVQDKLGEKYEKIILPSNLYIWATMNSADQGVMPLDTAFKRRWNFTYIGVDDIADSGENSKAFKEDYKFRYSPKSDEEVLWDVFRREVNERLEDCNVPEDKLIGPYFISKSTLELEDKEKIREIIKNKVLMYLFEDAGKAYRSKLFPNIKTFSKLCNEFDDDIESIFNNKLNLQRVKEETKEVTEDESE